MYLKFSIFDETFEFWRKFWFLTKLSSFDENFDFWPKFRFLTKISIFDENFDLSRKFQFLGIFKYLFEIFDTIASKSPNLTGHLLLKRFWSFFWKVIFLENVCATIFFCEMHRLSWNTIKSIKMIKVAENKILPR
mgnify:CR=1 FL=1